MIGMLKDLSFNRDGTQNVTVTVSSDFSEAYDELKDNPVNVEIKKASKHRSLSANAYAWVLLDQIASKSGVKVSEVYRNAIREIGGISALIGIKDEAIPLFRQSWEKGHLGRQSEIIPGSSKPGWSNVKIWFGSSEFDSIQMARFIDSLIQDAEALGIPTISDKEAEKLLGKWAVKHEEHSSG